MRGQGCMGLLRASSLARKAFQSARLSVPTCYTQRRSLSAGHGSTSVQAGVPYTTSYGSEDVVSPASSFPTEADVVVIGGGVAGSSALYHLTKLGVKNVVLLESAKLTAGTTWHSAGIVWRLRPGSDTTTQLLTRTHDLLGEGEESLKAESNGVDPGWIQHGALFLASSRERLDEYKIMESLASNFGIEAPILSPKETQKLFPLMNVDDLYGAQFSPDAGMVEPSGITQAYSRAAILRGAKIFEECAVTAIETKEGSQSTREVSAVHTGRGVIRTNCVLNAAGGWSPQIGALAGVHVPLVVMKHAYVVTEPIAGLKGCPMIMDQDQSLYVKVHGDCMSFGGYEKDSTVIDKLASDFNFGLYDLDWDMFSSHLLRTAHRIPRLETAGMKSTVSGPESFTVDGFPLLGESPEVRGFFLSCAFNSSGIMLSGGCGQQIAEWIVRGKPSLDMFAYDVKRFSPICTQNRPWLLDRCHESMATKNRVRFPHDEPLAGRNHLRRDPLHQVLLEAGCVYQDRHGWERPGWFMSDALARGKLPEVLPYDFYGSYGKQVHQDYAYRAANEQDSTFQLPGCFDTITDECRACREHATLFNMSSFGKYVLVGQDARAAADWLFTNDVGEPGRVVYTCMLNRQGTTEPDMTVARVPESLAQWQTFSEASADNSPMFYVACGGSVVTYAKSHMRKALAEKKFDAKLVDISGQLGVLSLQGPVSETILQKCTEVDISKPEYRQHGRQFPLLIDGDEVWAMRMSYVGEFGYELHVPMASLPRVYHFLMAQGKKFGLRNAGYRAIDFLSAEQGYHHWSSDLSTTDTPLEAGLGPVCSSTKEYLGSDVVQQQRTHGISRKRICLVIGKHSQLPLHDRQAVVCDGKVVSYIRHHGYSVSNDQWVAYAYVNKDPGVKLDNELLQTRQYEIQQMDSRTPAVAYRRSPFAKPGNAKTSDWTSGFNTYPLF